jgi:hypothetical protein
MTIKMYHPELPDAEIDVVLPAGAAILRQSGWRTADEMPKDSKPKSASATTKTEEK